MSLECEYNTLTFLFVDFSHRLLFSLNEDKREKRDQVVCLDAN